MAKQEIKMVDFRDLVTIVPGSTPSKYWGSERPAHDPNQGKQSIREVLGERGETLAVFISYEAGAVKQEVEIPAGNIAGIVRRSVAEVVAVLAEKSVKAASK